MRPGIALLLVLLLPVSASALSLDIAPSLSRGEISPGGNATLNISLRTSEEVSGVALEVTAPFAAKLEIEPARREVGPMGPGEERGPYSFALTDRGLDPGKYTLRIRATVNGSTGPETRTTQVELRVHPATSPKSPGFEALAGLLALAAALAVFKGREGKG